MLSATFNLAPGKRRDDQGRHGRLPSASRRQTARSICRVPAPTFTPRGYFAGKLIMDAGLRGHAVGGAQVSEKHCGFIVNADHATAADVDELIHDIQAKVREQFGVDLEPEVHRVGEFL